MAAMVSLSAEVRTEEEYKALIKDRRHALIFFWASWHEPSKPGGQMDSVFTGLASRHGSLAFAKIEAENADVAAVSEALGVTVVPTFVAVSAGKFWGKIEGANPQELNAFVKRFQEAINSEPVIPTPDVVDENTRIVGIVNSAPVMLFMKGVPDAPRCGFSRKIVELLRLHKITFASFDILTDEAVRSGLKVLYNWPTYPQMYVRGSLIGGLDILTEMAADTSTPLVEQLGLSQNASMSLETIDDKLRRLTTSAPVVLFMKGVPSEPRCGFSRSIVQILRDEGIEFDSFDILKDDEVREELKRFSNWPTYPQLYAKGSLVGGLDIVTEMKEEGPLLVQLGLN